MTTASAAMATDAAAEDLARDPAARARYLSGRLNALFEFYGVPAVAVVRRCREAGWPMTSSWLSQLRSSETIGEPSFAAVAALADAWQIDIGYFSTEMSPTERRGIDAEIRMARLRYGSGLTRLAMEMCELPPDQREAVMAVIDVLARRDSRAT